MMRTVRNVSSILLPLAIAAFAAGCSHNASQARSAGSPTFESSVPSSGQGGPGVGGSSYGAQDRSQGSAQGGPGVSGMNHQGGPLGEGQRHPDVWNYGNLHPVEADRVNPDRVGQGMAGSAIGGGQAQQGSAGQASTGATGSSAGDVGQAQQGSGMTGQAAGGTGIGAGDTGPDAGQVCAALKQSDFQVQDIPGGVSVRLSPPADQGYASLRLNVSQLVSQSDVSSVGQAGQAGAQCPLYQLTHDGTVTTTMRETPDGIDLSFTSAGDGIGKVRNQVHGFFHGAGNQTQQAR